jgi:filamentous hemagglutinin
VDDLVADSRPLPETKGRTRQFARSGGQEAANADFDALNPSDVKDYGDGKRVGKLADGRTVVVRPSSSSGAPTLEIQDGKKYTKFRYDD